MQSVIFVIPYNFLFYFSGNGESGQEFELAKKDLAQRCS